jgi:PIN domain nuclease of toxin-antitoxin system
VFRQRCSIDAASHGADRNRAASQILSDLNQQIGLSVCQFPMATVMGAALGVKWTREPGDRIIVANAIANNEAPLVTSDRRIHVRYPNAIW